jgi:branched-chain amino acid transport system substrate-binding protein
MKKINLLFAFSVTVYIVIVAFSSSVFAKDPIHIGFSTDFSGLNAQIGIEEAAVVDMVVKEVNAAGGINGRLIELHTLDNGGEPSRTVGNLKLLKDVHKCVAMVSGVNSSCGIAAKGWAEKNKVPVITEGAMTDKVLVKNGKAWFFKSCASVSTHADATLLRIKNLGHKKMAFQGSTLAWGLDVRDCIKRNASAYGLEYVAEVLCEPKSKDLTIQATRLRDSGADVVVTADYEAETGVWGQALKTVGWKPFVFPYSSGIITNTLKVFPKELFEGWETTMLVDSSDPDVIKLWDDYEKFTGKRYEDDAVPRMHDAISLLIEAVRLSDDPDNPKAIREGFYKIKDFPLMCGRQGKKGGFAPGRNETLSPEDIVVYVVKDGMLRPVK